MLVAIIGVGAYAGKVYFDVKGTVKDIQVETTREKSTKRDEPVKLDEKEPFSVLLLGIDSGDLGRTEQGRSDTIIVATVNPKLNKVTLRSIVRDTYTEIVGLGMQDKLNHAYAFGGVEMSMNSVENLLDVPIDHYVSINMKGLQELVDAVGGVDLENTIEFSQDSFNFPLGSVHLSGEAALAYSRMRYEDPNGDYGRQDRQQKIITAIVKKALNISTLTNYSNILDALENNLQTDLSWDNLMDIQKDYRSAFNDIQHDKIQGVGVMRDGVSYQDIPAEELTRVREAMKAELAK